MASNGTVVTEKIIYNLSCDGVHIEFAIQKKANVVNGPFTDHSRTDEVEL